MLVVGLVLGIALPGLSEAMVPYLPAMVAVLLALTAFRIGAKAAFGALGDLAWSIPAVLVLQIALPVVIAGVMWALGVLGTPLALALVLATAAPTLTGGPSLAILLRQDPARVMQMMVLGTALFPLTAFVVLQVTGVVEVPGSLFAVGLRSLAVIAVAAGVGFVSRRALLPEPQPEQLRAADGAVILMFAVIVIGLMAALGPALRLDPVGAVWWILAAFALGFGLQVLVVMIMGQGRLAPVAGPLALAAGNRNIALFLIALPPDVMAPIMIFIACWQLPMYLTPIVLEPLYRRV